MEKGTLTAYARAPLRIGLAGGGSDVDPFCSLYGGRVLNATISQYVHARVSTASKTSTIRSRDQDLEVALDDESARDKLPLHFNTYRFFVDRYLDKANDGFSIETYTDAPVGSGLGTSSTLVVSIVSALARHFKVNITNYELAHAAQVIEREMCGFAGGRQDSYSATFGGVNYMEFESEKNLINPLKIPRESVLALESHLILFHMGTSRKSADIIQEQSNSVNSGGSSSLEAMMRIRDEAEVMKNHLLTGNMEGIVDSLLNGWMNKKASSGAVSNDFIEQVYETALSAGAKAGKVSGAGGGGFMLFYVDIPDRAKLMQELKQFGGYTTNVNFTDQGVESWSLS